MYESELTAALDAVTQACHYLTEEYRRFQAIPNATSDITTHADRQAQEIVLQALLKAFPEDALCAEEATPTLQSARHEGDRLWIVDPIDGTRGFAVKNGEFSVMVGFLHEGQLGVGIVAQPAVERVTYATRGGGCWRIDAGATPVQCRVTKVAALAEATLTQSRSKDRTPSKYVQALKPGRVVESYSAGIKLALVARGEADVYLNTYDKFHDWDIAAGEILVTEAGGQVSGIRGEVLKYGLPGAWQRAGLIASNGLIHDAAVAAASGAA